MVLTALLLGAAGGGCASILGFEDTTLRTGNEEGGTPVDEGGLPLPDGDVPVDAGAPRLTANPTALVLRRGGSVDVDVVLARGASITGTVTARLAKLPAGVTATTATLPAPATTATLTLSASASATLGPATITLTADGTTLPPVALALTVAESAGALDVSFNASGVVTDSTKGASETYYALAVQPDGLIVAGGGGATGATAPNTGWIVRRYGPSGIPDAAFTNAFTVGPAALLTEGQVQAMALDATGKIVCVGASTQPTPALTIARLLPSGGIDGTFAGGIVRLPLTEGPMGSTGLGLVLQADGSVIVVGSRRDALNAEAGIIARFKSNGTRDATFNGGATVVIPATRLVGASLEASGAVLAAGSTISGALPSFFLTRRTSLGANDPTFGTAGAASFGNTYRANAFARLADDSLALVGDVQQGAAAYTAGVANAKGDAVFARAFATAPSAGFFGLAVQSDTRLIAAGHTAVVNGEARVERFFQDGGKDLSFSDGGAAILEPAGIANGLDVTLFAAAVQSDGRILVAGNRSTTGAVIYRLWP